MQQINSNSLEQLWQTKFSEELVNIINGIDFSYESESSTDDVLLRIIESMHDHKEAGSSRSSDWDDGWGENLREYLFTGAEEDLIPRYYGKYDLVRLNGEFVRPTDKMFEFNMISTIVRWMTEKYLMGVDHVFEFGCGPGHNIPIMASINTSAEFTGLDWAGSSQRILREMRDREDIKVFGQKFDFFNPDYSINVPENSGFITVAALEQVGSNFQPFVGFCLTKKPTICVHIEPIIELMNPNDLLDRFSILYCKQRNYLQGFLPFIKMLESRGDAEILMEQRTHTGSLYIEGHSIVVWRPL